MGKFPSEIEWLNIKADKPDYETGVLFLRTLPAYHKDNPLAVYCGIKNWPAMEGVFLSDFASPRILACIDVLGYYMEYTTLEALECMSMIDTVDIKYGMKFYAPTPAAVLKKYCAFDDKAAERRVMSVDVQRAYEMQDAETLFYAALIAEDEDERKSYDISYKEIQRKEQARARAVGLLSVLSAEAGDDKSNQVIKVSMTELLDALKFDEPASRKGTDTTELSKERQAKAGASRAESDGLLVQGQQGTDVQDKPNRKSEQGHNMQSKGD